MTQREIKITKHIFVNLLLTLNYVIKHHLFWLFISGLNKGQSSWLSTCLHHIIMFIYIQRVSVLTWAVSARSWQRCLTKCSALRAVSNSVCLEQHCSHNSLCLSSLSWRIKKNTCLCKNRHKVLFTFRQQLQDFPKLPLASYLKYIWQWWPEMEANIWLNCVSHQLNYRTKRADHKAIILTIAWRDVVQSPPCVIHFSCSCCSCSIHTSTLSRPDSSSECQTHCWSHSPPSPTYTDRDAQTRHAANSNKTLNIEIMLIAIQLKSAMWDAGM